MIAIVFTEKVYAVKKEKECHNRQKMSQGQPRFNVIPLNKDQSTGTV
jgi:hypothetical protein